MRLNCANLGDKPSWCRWPRNCHSVALPAVHATGSRAGCRQHAVDDAGTEPIDGGTPALTYSDVGATASAHLPHGFRHQRRMQQIGSGHDQFVAATRRLMTWDMHRRAGIGVDVDSPVFPDQIALLKLQFGPLKITAPVRVVYLVEELRECGFAYGTLASHPEIGEERFVVRIDEQEIVWAEICAFSRPGRWFTRLGGSVARRIQDAMTQKYLDALDPAPYPCPCCHHRTLPEIGQYDLCPVCYWEDDPHQRDHPDSTVGANGKSLVNSRLTYLEIGAMDRLFLNRVRPARPAESLDDGR